MFNALRFLGWPLLVGLLVALLIIQRYPQLVGLKEHDLGLQQAPWWPPHLSRARTPTPMPWPGPHRPLPTCTPQRSSKDRAAAAAIQGPLFQRFFSDNLPRQRRMESSLGSAVIMSSEGYLLTNNHVTANAEQIVVCAQGRPRNLGG